jgi:uncharacterized protein YdeI (BOF family)
MNKILALVSLLILAAACATQPSGNKDMPANANNANKPAETKSAGPASEADIIAKEKASWDGYRCWTDGQINEHCGNERF